MRETSPVEPARESPAPREVEPAGESKTRARLAALKGDGEGAVERPRAPSEWAENQQIDVHAPAEQPDVPREAVEQQDALAAELSDADRAEVADYTGNGFADLNRELREGAVSPEKTERAEALSRALAKMPVYEGEVYRGANLDAQAADRYRVGAVVTEDAFTSTSRDLPFQEKNTYWTIQSRSGRDVSALSTWPTEQEVLFDRGSKFRVTDNFTVGSERHIVMEEVD